MYYFFYNACYFGTNFDLFVANKFEDKRCALIGFHRNEVEPRCDPNSGGSRFGYENCGHIHIFYILSFLWEYLTADAIPHHRSTCLNDFSVTGGLGCLLPFFFVSSFLSGFFFLSVQISGTP